MFKKLIKSLYAVPALMVATTMAFAQPVAVDAVKSASVITALATSNTAYIYAINMFTYVGGFLTAAALLGGLGLMAWQAFSGDDEAAKVAQTWFPKIVLAGLCGVLLLAGPTVFSLAGDLLGGTAPTGLGPASFGK